MLQLYLHASMSIHSLAFSQVSGFSSNSQIDLMVLVPLIQFHIDLLTFVRIPFLVSDFQSLPISCFVRRLSSTGVADVSMKSIAVCDGSVLYPLLLSSCVCPARSCLVALSTSHLKSWRDGLPTRGIFPASINESSVSHL